MADGDFPSFLPLQITDQSSFGAWEWSGIVLSIFELLKYIRIILTLGYYFTGAVLSRLPGSIYYREPLEELQFKPYNETKHLQLMKDTLNNYLNCSKIGMVEAIFYLPLRATKKILNEIKLLAFCWCLCK